MCVNDMSVRQVSYVKTFGMVEASDDIDTVLDAVAAKMGFNLKKQQAASSKMASQLHSAHAAHLHHSTASSQPSRDILRAAQYLIKSYRSGALGRFVLDDADE